MAMTLEAAIRTIPDYPKPGILFRDITTLLGDPAAFAEAVDRLTEVYQGQAIDRVAGIEARGFILGAAIAYKLGAGFIPLRKKGKLPHHTHAVEYALEYGHDCLEMHQDACEAGQRVLLIDDLIATGGTALAAVKLLRQGGAVIVGTGFVIDLPDLGGAELIRAEGLRVEALVPFAGH
jgi:adenine phosphoribosyltransferase